MLKLKLMEVLVFCHLKNIKNIAFTLDYKTLILREETKMDLTNYNYVTKK